MNIAKVEELPSDRKFGWFFTAIFLIGAGYFYHISSDTWLYMFAATGVAFFVVTVVRAEVLSPLNRLWMKFGLLLGMIVSPIVMGIIFFGIFTPIGLLMRLFGRDELRLTFNQRSSHWISRNEALRSDFFKDQF